MNKSQNNIFVKNILPSEQLSYLNRNSLKNLNISINDNKSSCTNYIK